MKAIHFQFANFNELAELIDANADEQDLEPTCPCGDFLEGDWVLVTFGVAEQCTSLAACLTDRGRGLRICFGERDWSALWEFAHRNLEPNPPPSIPPPPIASDVCVDGTQVLVIDDDVDTQAVVKGLLQSSGYRVLVCDSAERAFDVLRLNRVDLIILEWSLPAMSGVEFCQRIRRDKRLRELPLIFLSTHSSTERLREAFLSGANDYVSKPFRGPELAARVASLLQTIKPLLGTG